MAPESRFEIVKYRVVSPMLKMGDVQLGCFFAGKALKNKTSAQKEA